MRSDKTSLKFVVNRTKNKNKNKVRIENKWKKIIELMVHEITKSKNNFTMKSENKTTN